MTAALPAFLLEAAFYLATVMEETRLRFAEFHLAKPRARILHAALLWLSAVAPYLVFSLSAGTFDRNAFYLLAGLTALLSFWYVFLPWRGAYDFGFLVIAAAPVVARVFPRIYRSPDDHLRIDVLGHLMWIRLGIMALLILREWDPGAFGIWPKTSEWRAGIFYYLIAVVPIVLLALGLHDVRYAPLTGPWWRIAGIGIGTFFGTLWIVALSEELFFRGVIERALLNGWRSPTAAVAISAVLYGASHLWFHEFPNWRRALVTLLLGIACGIVYAQNGSVRAPMVTHAFVVATWRLFFK